MTQKNYTVENRQFRTQSDYSRALHDKRMIDGLRGSTEMKDRDALEKLLKDLKGGKYQFLTLLGEDFREEVEEALKQAAEKPEKKPKKNRRAQGGSTASPELDAYVQQELKLQEKRRKRIIVSCGAMAVICLGYFGIYSWYSYKSESQYKELSQLKEQPAAAAQTPDPDPGPLYTLDGPAEPKEVLEEYKNLLNKNKKLIGWLKIDDTNIDYPVMQTNDNEYYLTHDLNQNNDRNGAIFMDKDCDVLKPSTNFILYGHHMKSGKMFGQLDKFADEEYYREHPSIRFDTIYEKGVYDIMYVFRSRVYSEEEIVFKYYQFIDANSEQEFDSYMNEMKELSLYDTGVTAEYGDQLLTLSTCDYQEKNGRFVVVAKKVKE